MINFDKFVNTLSTSHLYEKGFRHCKSDYIIDGLGHGPLFLNMSTNSPNTSRIFSKSHKEKIIGKDQWPMVDYIHSPTNSPKIRYNMPTPDILKPGYKVKIT